MRLLAVIGMKSFAYFSRLSGLNGVFDVLVSPKNFGSSVDGYAGKVDTISLCVGDASNAASVIRPNAKVSRVFKAINSPKVVPSVVGSVSIDVINFVRGLPRLHPPNNAMSRKSFPPNGKAYVSIRFFAASNLASVLGVPSFARCFAALVSADKVALRPFAPKKASSMRVILKQFAQRFLAGKFKFFHSNILCAIINQGEQMFSSVHLVARKNGVTQ